MNIFNCEGVLWIYSHCFRIGVFLCFQISQFYPLSVLLPLSVARDGVLVVTKRSTNRSWSLDKARGQGALLNVSFQKTPTRSSPAVNEPPINGKGDSSLLSINGKEGASLLSINGKEVSPFLSSLLLWRCRS